MELTARLTIGTPNQMVKLKNQYLNFSINFTRNSTTREDCTF